MQNMVYLPHLSKARLVRAYHFQSPQFGSHCAVLLSDCASPSPVQYAHVMVVNRDDSILGLKCFAVGAEVNKQAQPGGGRSHFLGVFHGLLGGPMHENRGASDEWADLAKFEARALSIIAERFGLAELPETLPVSEEMARRYELPRPYPARIGGAPPCRTDSKSQASKAG